MSYAIIECEKRNVFWPIEVDEILDEVHIKLPEFKETKSQKYGKKLNKLLNKYKVSNVVLSEKLSKNNIIKNMLYMQNNYIITGNKLYLTLINKAIIDMCEIMKVPIQTVSVAILCNEFSIENLELVKHISKNVKHVIVISENEKRFKTFSQKLMDEEGIALTILNSQNKNISRSSFVINIDFSASQIKRLIISKEAILISIREAIKELKKSFNGIIINDIDVYLGKESYGFRTLALCEAYIYDYRKKIKENEKTFETSEYRINGYLGNNGKITEYDFQRIAKNFVKNQKK